MERRSFLAGLGALVGGIAVEQAIPFNRVWSFPKEIVIHNSVAGADWYTAEALRHLSPYLKLRPYYKELVSGVITLNYRQENHNGQGNSAENS